MTTLSPGDRAALEIGRLFMRAHAAEQQVELLTAQLAEHKAAAGQNTAPERAAS